MTRKEILEFFARRDEAWRRHDFAALTADHSEDGEVESRLGGRIRGQAAIRNIYEGWFRSFPDVEYSTEHLLIDGNKAVQYVKMVGVHKGEFCGLPPTGKQFEIHCMFLFLFAGGKIEHEIRLYDFTAMLLHLGVLKAKPAF
jgi:steroid delta-isomerase-like uncharacterized protein